jgi:hypothetical protein
LSRGVGESGQGTEDQGQRQQGGKQLFHGIGLLNEMVYDIPDESIIRQVPLDDKAEFARGVEMRLGLCYNEPNG